jgi:hypothetical protein
LCGFGGERMEAHRVVWVCGFWVFVCGGVCVEARREGEQRERRKGARRRELVGRRPLQDRGGGRAGGELGSVARGGRGTAWRGGARGEGVVTQRRGVGAGRWHGARIAAPHDRVAGANEERARARRAGGGAYCVRERHESAAAVDERGLPRVWRQIVRTKAESQRIVATRPLCRVQYPVPYSSRLQVIHRAGSGNCDRSRLMQYGCAWLPPRGRPLFFRHGF